MSGKLTKAELSKEIARNCESTLKEGRDILELILGAMTRALSRGERVEIRGFGSFATRVRNPRSRKKSKDGCDSQRATQARPLLSSFERTSGRCCERLPPAFRREIRSIHRMPYKPYWLQRLPEIIAALRGLPDRLIDRPTFETIFGLTASSRD